MPSAAQSARDYALIASAIANLDDQVEAQPSLAQLALQAGLSPDHFQRVFKRWAGVSPKRFLQLLTVERAKAALRSNASVLSATYAAGLSGPGRTHDLFVALEAMTPGEYKAQGRRVVIRWGAHPTPFGECLLATTQRGVCWLGFTDPKPLEVGLAELQATWDRASFVEDRSATAGLVEQAFSGAPQGDPLTLHVKGTNLQVQVWRALLRIPDGGLVTYSHVAEAVGRPRAVRAVAGAVARNAVSYLIPCHRVIRKSGVFHAYRWGRARKRALLGWEAAQGENSAVR